MGEEVTQKGRGQVTKVTRIPDLGMPGQEEKSSGDHGCYTNRHNPSAGGAKDESPALQGVSLIQFPELSSACRSWVGGDSN